jgi:hypothetical protein
MKFEKYPKVYPKDIALFVFPGSSVRDPIIGTIIKAIREHRPEMDEFLNARYE